MKIFCVFGIAGDKLLRLLGALVCALMIGASASCRRSSPRVFKLQNELCPTSLAELVQMSVEDLERVDIGRMNLLCSTKLENQSVPELERLLRKLDEWAARARFAEEKYRRVFDRNPARYDHSLSKFRAVNLVLTLKEDYRCSYKMSLVDSGELYKINSPVFFKNSDDVFLCGLLRRRQGTCSSYAALIVALGRRLGYPLYMKATQGHLFCYWDDGVETFNLDTNGAGVDTPSDEHYFQDANNRLKHLAESDLRRERLMCPLSAAESLSCFLELAGYCCEANGRQREAQIFYQLALRYRPGAVNLTRLASRYLGQTFIQTEK